MNIFKNLIIYGIGAATGAFVAIKLLEDHYAAIADEEIEAVKKMAREKIKEIEDKYEKELTEKVQEEPKKENHYNKLVRDYEYEKEAEKKEHPREDEDYDELEEEMYEKEAESIAMNARPNVEPYLITEEEFSNEMLHYEKETLWFYVLDGTLCNDSEEIMDNVDMLIGEGTLDSIEDDQTIYIRNERQGSDFEIICLNKSYKEEVAGLLEEDN